MSVNSKSIFHEGDGRKLFFDENLLKVLSSNTRMEILRYLRCRQMTLTDLSRLMKFAKSTVHEHLGQLLAAGLINKNTTRKWIYYRLSKKGDYVMGIVG